MLRASSFSRFLNFTKAILNRLYLRGCINSVRVETDNRKLNYINKELFSTRRISGY